MQLLAYSPGFRFILNNTTKSMSLRFSISPLGNYLELSIFKLQTVKILPGLDLRTKSWEWSEWELVRRLHAEEAEQGSILLQTWGATIWSLDRNSAPEMRWGPREPPIMWKEQRTGWDQEHENFLPGLATPASPTGPLAPSPPEAQVILSSLSYSSKGSLYFWVCP